MQKKLKVYVGCALTHVAQENKKAFTSLLKNIKDSLADKGLEVLEFMSAIKENPTADEVYDYDLKCLNECDCMLALGDYPGTGLGYEISYTTELRKVPTMVAVSNENNASKLLRGVSHPHYKFIVFSNNDELIDSFISFISTFHEKAN